MQIESAIVQALKNIGMPEAPNKITIVLSDRGGVEPQAPYLLLNIISTTNIGLPTKSIQILDEKRVERVFQVKDFYVSFTFHAEAKSSTHDWVQRFHTGLTSDSVDWAFSQQGLGLVDSGGIMYQSQPVDGMNYKRANIDITFRAEVLDEFNVNTLDNVVVNGTLNGVDYELADVGHPFTEVANLGDEFEKLVNYNLPDAS